MPYIGQRPATGEANSFKILDEITSFTMTFDGSSAAVVSVANDTITAREHRFVTGQRVTYNDGGGTAITGLSDGVYYIIVEDRHTIKLASSANNAASGTAIDLTGLGAGASHTINVAFDGVNTKFKATVDNGTRADISRSGQLMLSVNGVLQEPHDNTTSPATGYSTDHASTIIFSVAPAATDQFFGRLIASNFSTFDVSDNVVDNFTGDGSDATFTLSKSPANNENVLVTIDGVVQYPDDNTTTRAYSVSENTITFASAPGNGVEIQVRHIGFAGASSAGITGFYGRTGNAALKNTDNIVFNDATASGDIQAANVTVTGDLTVQGTTTTLDTALTEVDKLEVAANNTTVAVAVTQSGSGDAAHFIGGNVGIGTDNPDQSLEVFKAAGTNLIKVSSQANSTNGIEFEKTGSTTQSWRIVDGQTVNGALEFYDVTNTATRMIIRSGNVGINQSNPTKKLEVAGGSVSFSPDTAGKHTHEFTTNASNDGRYFIKSDTTTKVDIQANGATYFNGGNFGIGTNNPTSKLQVANGHINLSSGYSIQWSDSHERIEQSDGKLEFFTANGEKMTLSGDKLGVGETTPASKVDIKGNVSSTTQFSGLDGLRIHNANGSTLGISADMYFTVGTGTANRGAAIGVEYSNPGPGNALYFATNPNAVTSNDTLVERMRITPDGRTLIGTSTPGGYADRLLSVGDVTSASATIEIRSNPTNGYSSIVFTDATTADVNSYIGTIDYSHNDNSMAFKTNALQRLRIDNIGRINIGNFTTFTAAAVGRAIVEINGTSSSLINFDVGGTRKAYHFTDGTDVYSYNTANGAYIFGTNDAEKVRITSGGNVGINQVSPSAPLSFNTGTGQKIELYNSGANNEFGFGLEASELRLCSGSGSFIGFRTGGYAGTERLRITAGGKIGINNSAPLYAMHFKNAMASSPSFIHMEVTGSNAIGGGGGIAFDTSASNSASNNTLYLATITGIRNSSDDGSNDLVFSTTKAGATGDDGNANTPKERLRITSDGRVSIGGVTAPHQELHIHGSGTSYIQFTDESSGTAAGDGAIFGLDHPHLYAWNYEAGDFIVATSATEALRITSSGQFEFQMNATKGKIMLKEGNLNAFSLDSNGANGYFRLIDEYDGFERLRMHGDGLFSINTTSGSNYAQTDKTPNIDTTSNRDGGNFVFRRDKGTMIIANDADPGWALMYINKFGWSSGKDNRWVAFYLNGTAKDNIYWNGSTIVYGTASDYRIKKNIRDFTGGIDKLKQIKVRLFDYKETDRGTDHVGFIAHELQEVVPDAVAGEKDAMREEEDTGNIIPAIQGVEYGKVTPLLTAALQEAIAKIETLEARIAALES